MATTARWPRGPDHWARRRWRRLPRNESKIWWTLWMKIYRVVGIFMSSRNLSKRGLGRSVGGSQTSPARVRPGVGLPAVEDDFSTLCHGAGRSDAALEWRWCRGAAGVVDGIRSPVYFGRSTSPVLFHELPGAIRDGDTRGGSVLDAALRARGRIDHLHQLERRDDVVDDRCVELSGNGQSTTWGNVKPRRGNMVVGIPGMGRGGGGVAPLVLSTIVNPLPSEATTSANPSPSRSPAAMSPPAPAWAARNH